MPTAKGSARTPLGPKLYNILRGQSCTCIPVNPFSLCSLHPTLSKSQPDSMARDDQIAGYDEQEIEREVQLMFPAPSCQCEVGIDPSDVCV